MIAPYMDNRPVTLIKGRPGDMEFLLPIPDPSCPISLRFKLKLKDVMPGAPAAILCMRGGEPVACCEKVTGRGRLKGRKGRSPDKLETYFL